MQQQNQQLIKLFWKMFFKPKYYCYQPAEIELSVPPSDPKADLLVSELNDWEYVIVDVPPVKPAKVNDKKYREQVKKYHRLLNAPEVCTEIFPVDPGDTATTNQQNVMKAYNDHCLFLETLERDDHDVQLALRELEKAYQDVLLQLLVAPAASDAAMT